MAPPADLLAAVEARLGHAFGDRNLLLQALTHRSYANEHPSTQDNEGLAFLGDAVLQLVVTEQLWQATPGDAVGVLTPRRAEMVSGVSLARWAARLELGPLLRLGRGEQQQGGQVKESVLATALEAVLGALYLEGGLPVVRPVVASLTLW